MFIINLYFCDLAAVHDGYLQLLRMNLVLKYCLKVLPLSGPVNRFVLLSLAIRVPYYVLYCRNASVDPHSSASAASKTSAVKVNHATSIFPKSLFI